MNYLAHAFLSFDDAELLTGNMIADYIKGKNALSQLPERIREGILLHRAIDRFTDEHPASKKVAKLFRESYGRYAPAIIDSLFDHYLANDKKHFENDGKLFEFTQKTYEQLASYEPHFPEKFCSFFPYMKEQNWLYNYRSQDGMNRSLKGLHRRAKYMPTSEKAFEIFLTNYSVLNEAYDEMMQEMISFVVQKINNIEQPKWIVLGMEN